MPTPSIPPSTPNWASKYTSGTPGSAIPPGKGVAPVNPLKGSPIHIVQLYEKHRFHEAIKEQIFARSGKSGRHGIALENLQTMADNMWKLALASTKLRGSRIKREHKRQDELIEEENLQKTFDRKFDQKQHEHEAYLEKEISKAEFKKQFESPEVLNTQLLEKLMEPLVKSEILALEDDAKVQESVNKLKAAVARNPLHIPSVIGEANHLAHALMGHIDKQSYLEELKRDNLEEYFQEFLFQGLAKEMGFVDAYLMNLCAKSELLSTQIDSIVKNHNPVASLGGSNLTPNGIFEYFKKAAENDDFKNKKIGIKANEIAPNEGSSSV